MRMDDWKMKHGFLGGIKISFIGIYHPLLTKRVYVNPCHIQIYSQNRSCCRWLILLSMVNMHMPYTDILPKSMLLSMVNVAIDG